MNAPELLAAPRAPAWRERTFWHALGGAFGTPLGPRAVSAPHWVARSDALARELGLAEWLHGDEALAVLAGNAVAAGSQPFASVYSGHQFGVWAGQLGDGRALLLGEVDTPDPSSGPMELQLKGSGLTPYSRMGDGRAVLRSSIREFLGSEAMHALGIPTTRALAVVGSPLPVARETMETAAVVTRVAPSFLRFGHFEHFAHTAQDPAALRALFDATMARFFPELDATPAALLEEVARRTARLVAQWQLVGFCHGVMNTDNLSLLGLTIDYGPFGFLDAFDPMHVCNHSDNQGRYAYARQPGVAFWNLHALAQSLLPLVDGEPEAASESLLSALEPFKAEFAQAMVAGLRNKLGLVNAQDDDAALADDLLKLMAEDHADFTITWRRLAQPEVARDGFLQRDKFDAWLLRYRARLAQEASDDAERAARMNAVNPKFVLRNHLAQEAIAAAQRGDFAPTERLLHVLERPFDEQPEHAALADYPPDWASHLEVSCSS
jgi:uncharacterized protein YdiU (UPF0061 family)